MQPSNPNEKIIYLNVEYLELDRENPRLPMPAADWTTPELVDYFCREQDLEELIESMLSNGFFEHEALLVLPVPAIGPSRYIVLAGNRRLAALMCIHGQARTCPIEIAPSAEQVQKLSRVPCIVTRSRQMVRRSLGFNHIGGVHAWSPEAKARFISDDVERFAANGSENPFSDVGFAYGAKSQGIRGMYIALAILTWAQRRLSIDVSFVLERRFGVWQRCINSVDLRDYIGFGSPKTFAEIQDALGDLDRERLDEVIKDLSPQSDSSKPLVSDSRNVTAYGAVLVNDLARGVLRKHRDLQLAIRISREKAES